MTPNTRQNKALNWDANASLPPLLAAKNALIEALSLEGNASSTHVLGRLLRARLDGAREQLARALGGRDKEIFFCSGASEGNRWLVDSLVHSGALRGRPYQVLASPFEHPSMMKCLKAKAESGQIALTIMPLNKGQLDLEQTPFEGAEVVVLTAAHNETGLLPDWDTLLARLSPETILISDASQAVARTPVLPERVDAIVASAHKMGGVVGAGAVLVRGRARTLSSPWAGGGQEAGLRPGSESVPLIVAMGEAAAHIEQSRQEHQQLAALRDEVEEVLLKAWPFAFVVGAAEARLPQTLAICLDGVNAEGLRIAIDQAGLCVGFGSACSALAPEPSPALLAMGLSPTQAKATIRISLAPGVSREDLLAGVERLLLAVDPILQL